LTLREGSEHNPNTGAAEETVMKSKLLHLLIGLAVSGCSRAPTMDLFGSFFPAWMLCAAIGIVATVVVRQILAIAGINQYVIAPLLTYTGLAISATLLIWLLWFGH